MAIDARAARGEAVRRVLCSACSARGTSGIEACFGDFKFAIGYQ
jgi:hypothetical protein